MQTVIIAEDVDQKHRDAVRPIIYPGSPIGESSQVEDSQVNVELHVLIGDDVPQSAPSPSPPGLARWCIGLFPLGRGRWGAGGVCSRVFGRFGMGMLCHSGGRAWG